MMKSGSGKKKLLLAAVIIGISVSISTNGVNVAAPTVTRGDNAGKGGAINVGSNGLIKNINSNFVGNISSEGGAIEIY